MLETLKKDTPKTTDMSRTKNDDGYETRSKAMKTGNLRVPERACSYLQGGTEGTLGAHI